MTTTLRTPETLAADPTSVPEWARGAEASLASQSEDGQVDAYDLFRDDELIGSMYDDGDGYIYVQGASVADGEWEGSEIVGSTKWVHLGDSGSMQVYANYAEIADNGERGDARMTLVLTRKPTDPAPHIVMTTNGDDSCVAWIEPWGEGDSRVELVDSVEADWFESFPGAPTEREELSGWLHSLVG